jgi:hypothetical protein
VPTSWAHSCRDAAPSSPQDIDADIFYTNFSKLTNFIKYCTYAIEKVKDVYHHFMLGQPLPWILLPLLHKNMF